MRYLKKHDLVIARPDHEVALFGGPASVRVSVGTVIRVHPASDLFMQGAKHAVVAAVSEDGETLKVRPMVMGAVLSGKLRVLASKNVLIDEKGIG